MCLCILYVLVGHCGVEWRCPEAAVVMLEGEEITEATLIYCKHDCTLTHTLKHTQKGHRRYTGRGAVSLPLSHTRSHVWCMWSKQCIYWNWQKISRQHREHTHKCINTTTRNKKRCPNLSFSLFHPLLFPSLLTSLSLLLTHDNKSSVTD